MKKLLVGALAVAVVAILCGAAVAEGCCDKWDDLSWWCKSGATPGAYKDPVRSGYWWWPTTPQGGVYKPCCSTAGPGNENDAVLWGNRGVVYGMCIVEPEPPKEVVKEVPKPEPILVDRTVPEFGHVLFDFDKAVIRPDGATVIDAVVEDLKKFEKDNVTVEGHTCDIGSEAYNQGLGQRRADAVKRYMVEHGLADGRITSTSFGETQWAVPNDSPANRKLNRRAVFKIQVNTKVPQTQ